MAPGPTIACVLLAVAATGCRTRDCPDITTPAPPAPAPPAPPACTPLSQTDAQSRADAWLAARTNAPAAPAELTARACTSHCQRRSERATHAAACATWSCPYRYGDDYYLANVTFDVYVTACGAAIFTVRPYARCFAKPHRCALAVRLADARAIAARTLGEVGGQDILLQWAADQGEFRWVVRDGETGETEVLWISAHAADQITRLDPPIPFAGRS